MVEDFCFHLESGKRTQGSLASAMRVKDARVGAGGLAALAGEAASLPCFAVWSRLNSGNLSILNSPHASLRDPGSTWWYAEAWTTQAGDHW